MGVWESEDLNPATLTSWEKIGFVKSKDGQIQSTTFDRSLTSIADGGISTGQFNDAAIGTNGLPIISYWDQTNGDLIVYSCTNQACTSGSAVTISDPSGDVWGRETSIVIGSDGYPVIAHYNSTDGDIAITKCGDASCSSNTTTKFPNAQVAGNVRVDIVIGADDLPVLGYAQNDGSESDPVISQCTTIACTALTTTVLNDGSDNSGHYGSITIGSDDLPVYAYRNTTETGLAVAKCTNTSCTAYGIQLAYDDPSGFQNGYDTSIIISPDGYPLISHYITSTQDLITTKCVTHNCTQGSNITTQHTNSMSYGLWTSMALGTDNLPIISSWRDTASSTINDSLIISRCLNDACTSVSSPLEFQLGRVAEYTSLVIGTDGYPFVTWWDYNAGADNNLGILKCADSTCSSRSSDTVGRIEVKTATTSGGLATAEYREVSSGDSIGAGVGEVWLKIKITFRRDLPNWSESLGYSDNSAGGANVWNCERAYGRYFSMPTIESVTASYNTAGGGGSAPTEDQFMRHGAYFSGGIEQPYYLD